jgi:hypothetical protein
MGEPRGEPSKFQDSGVISGDYSEDLGAHRDFDIDAMSDGDFSEVGNYPGIRVASKESSEPLSMEVEAALRHLNPADVERRRKLMGRNYRWQNYRLFLRETVLIFSVAAMTLTATISALPASSLVLMSTSRASPMVWSGQPAARSPACPAWAVALTGTPVCREVTGTAGCRTSCGL